MFVDGSAVNAVEVSAGIFRKILTYNEEIMVCEFFFKKGAIMSGHSHVNLQNSYVISGKLKFVVNGEEKILTDGCSILFEANDVHGGEALEETRVLDVFSPMRKDFF